MNTSRYVAWIYEGGLFSSLSDAEEARDFCAERGHDLGSVIPYTRKQLTNLRDEIDKILSGMEDA